MMKHFRYENKRKTERERDGRITMLKIGILSVQMSSFFIWTKIEYATGDSWVCVPLANKTIYAYTDCRSFHLFDSSISAHKQGISTDIAFARNKSAELGERNIYIYTAV